MSSFGGIINLLVFFIILIGFLFVLTKGVQGVKFSTSIKKNLWILGGYIILLLCFTIMYFLSSPNKLLEVQDYPYDERGYILYDRLLNKEYIEEHYLASKESISINDKELILIGEGHFDFTIMLEKTDELKDEIEIFIYKGLFEINQVDFSDDLPLPSTSFSDNTLKIDVAPFFEKHMAYLTPEFPFAQFSGEKWSMQGSSSSSRDAIIYIKVPENVEVSWNEDVMYVTEVK